MNSQKKSKSSNRWLLEHFNDKYVKEAQKNKIRSRAWFKLEQLDKTNKLFKIGMNVIDLGAAPGSWSQYAITKIGKTGYIAAFDVLPIKPIKGVNFFQGDIRNKKIFNLVLSSLSDIKFDLVMSDMSPNITGNFSIDMPRIINLCKLALKISDFLLSKNGIFLLKSFQGEGFNEFYKEIKTLFKKVKICKPKTSRTRSREIFILAIR
ncbi:MAG: 23S rRNA (uridine(2552)-2'-O)-methyltransferase RlmE [Buchnera aphidicola (Brevicoryne brassicae)]|uniref:Ribosomal RNA large subunit methyltransferase E n=1 Tax=Buchnera aphidicola (Brevicoryne brassicae) TaxID=911343 RepID=A0AAJ5PUA4_9GAMM|nr:23S rRNA (uridine(2552)-2'-O)-methyltransferase RlmE [Buchnera aphidicola]QCI19942.1 23S rRNA (uridine(2552)-2'-O)-methyltransferase RlmE [Buchnera aphidicola (Brevicoryne brassicae)]WAI18765.1 MAG: 23S rRNA (uridine(2552)-2'-O)-methyltransferase RlmE [Buchnera aphidicola (Brevicoryne brassicae)]